MEQDVDDKKLIASIILLERFVRDIYPSRESSAIQPLQWSILRYLARMPADRREVRFIAKFLGLTRAPVTRAVAKLESRDLVCQRSNADDARTKTIYLTASGKTALEYDPVIDAVARVRTLPVDMQREFINSVRSIALETGVTNNDKSKEDIAR